MDKSAEYQFMFKPTVHCGNCNRTSDNEDREKHYMIVRKELTEIINSSAIGYRVDFAQNALDLCKTCDYSDAKVIKLVDEAIK